MPSSRLEITTLPSQQVERLEVQTMIFLLSCLFTGSLNPPNNDGNKEAIKKRYDCFRLEVCTPGTRQQAQIYSQCLADV